MCIRLERAKMSPVVSFPFSVVSFPFTRTVWMEWFMPRGQIVRQHWLCIYMLFTCHPRRAKCSLFFFRKIQALLTGPIVTNLVSCSKLYFWSRGPRMPHRAHSERLRFPRPIVLIIVAACGRSSSWSASVERDGSDHGGLLFRTCSPPFCPSSSVPLALVLYPDFAITSMHGEDTVGSQRIKPPI